MVVLGFLLVLFVGEVVVESAGRFDGVEATLLGSLALLALDDGVQFFGSQLASSRSLESSSSLSSL